MIDNPGPRLNEDTKISGLIEDLSRYARGQSHVAGLLGPVRACKPIVPRVYPEGLIIKGLMGKRNCP